MATYVNFKEEIRRRIENAMLVGGQLREVKTFSLRDSERNRQEMMAPWITLTATSSEYPYDTQRLQASIKVKINIGVSKLFDSKNNQYDFYSETGPDYFQQKLLDVLNRDTLGRVSLDYGGILAEIPTVEIRDAEYDAIIGKIILINAKTTPFFPGTRSEANMSAPVMTQSGTIPFVDLLKIAAGDLNVTATLPSLRDENNQVINDGKRITIERDDHGSAHVYIAGYSEDQLIGGQITFELVQYQSVITVIADAGNWVIGA